MDGTIPTRIFSTSAGWYIAEDLLITNEFFLENLKGNYSEDIDCLKEFATAIQNNLIHNIMIGNFVLPQNVPPLTLMIKDTSYKLIPTPVVSNFEEEQTTTLTPVLLENIKITQGKRNLVNVDNCKSQALKRSTMSKNAKFKSGLKYLAENNVQENPIHSDDSFVSRALRKKPTKSKAKTPKKQKVCAPPG